MKLLITTQIVDREDPVLGFFHRWIEELSTHYESVEVITLFEGAHNLPPHVHVHSLGKLAAQTNTRARARSLSRIGYVLKFYGFIWRLRREYDDVFVHMNPEYIVLGGLLWRVLRKRVALWYLHKSVTRSLRIAEKMVDVIFTATPESFRLPSPKVRVVGHGIDIVPQSHAPSTGGMIRIATIGRFSASKGIRESLAALELLYQEGIPFAYVVAGAPGTRADFAYEESVRLEVEKRPWKSSVKFLGALVHDEVPGLLAQTDVFLHLSDTGSLDKAQLEALAAGVPTVTSSDAGKALVPAEWRVDRLQPQSVASAIRTAYGADMRELSARIAHAYNLSALMNTIVAAMPVRQEATPKTRSLRSLLRALLAVRDVLEPVAGFQEVSILCYHSVGDASLDTAVSVAQFERHLSMLEHTGVVFVSLSEVVAWMNGVATPPRRAVALTFDDGYRDFLSSVLPILEKHSAPATVFVVGDETSARSLLENDLPLMTTKQIEDLLNHPLVTIGYHSRSHADTRSLSDAELNEEYAPRFTARFFAYPGGNYDERALQVVRTLHYEAACSIKRGLVEEGGDLRLLPRNVVMHDTPDWMVRAYTTKAIAWYRRVRSKFL